jgi:hypothetical protein
MGSKPVIYRLNEGIRDDLTSRLEQVGLGIVISGGIRN